MLLNIGAFISAQSCINFSPRSCIDAGWVGLLWKIFSSVSQRFSVGLRPIHVRTWCLTLPEPLFHSLSLINPAIVILEYLCAIREENWWNNLLHCYIHVVSWPHFFGQITLLKNNAYFIERRGEITLSAFHPFTQWSSGRPQIRCPGSSV